MKYAILLSVLFLMACGQGKKYHDKEKTVAVESDLVRYSELPEGTK